MQHLLDFIQEHSLDEQLYFVAHCPGGALESLWRRGEADGHWQLRPHGCEGPWELVRPSELIAELESRGADLAGVKRELNAMLAAQIAFADLILRDANRQLGRGLVQRFLVGHQDFVVDLQAAIEQLTAHAPKPSIAIVHGGGLQTTPRAGHLSVVR